MTISVPPSLNSNPVLQIAPSFLDDRSGSATRCRSLATMLAALWSGMESHSGGASYAHSCLVVGVDTNTGELGLRLSLAFADSGRPTTLIDAAGLPGMLRFFEAAPVIAAQSNGRVSHLPGTGGPAAGETVLPTNVSELAVASMAAAPGETDLRRDDQLAALLDRLKTVANGVAIVVVPPLRQSPDALPLVRHVDGVMLAVQPGRTGRPEAIRACNGIVAAGGRVLGIVLSNEGGPGGGAGFRLAGLLR